jgi:hypothetical protein
MLGALAIGDRIVRDYQERFVEGCPAQHIQAIESNLRGYSFREIIIHGWKDEKGFVIFEATEIGSSQNFNGNMAWSA